MSTCADSSRRGPLSGRDLRAFAYLAACAEPLHSFVARTYLLLHILVLLHVVTTVDTCSPAVVDADVVSGVVLVVDADVVGVVVDAGWASSYSAPPPREVATRPCCCLHALH
jgi:hypothetical protein